MKVKVMTILQTEWTSLIFTKSMPVLWLRVCVCVCVNYISVLDPASYYYVVPFQ